MEISAADLRRSSRSPSLAAALGGVERLTEVEEVLNVDLRVGLVDGVVFDDVEAPIAELGTSST